MPRAKQERTAPGDQSVRADSEQQQSTAPRAGRGRKQAVQPTETPTPEPEAVIPAPKRGRGRQTPAANDNNDNTAAQPETPAPRPQRGRRAAQPEPTPVVTAAATPGEPTPKPRRGRKARAEDQLADAASPEGGIAEPVPVETAPVETAPVEITPTEDAAAVTTAEPVEVAAEPAPVAQPPNRRGRKAKAATEPEAQPEAVASPAVETAGAPRNRRGRQAKAQPVAEAEPAADGGQAEPEQATEPVLLEVPRTRRGRKPKVVTPVAERPQTASPEDLPLTEVLGGVEPVAVEDPDPAGEAPQTALAVAPDGGQPLPLVDHPALEGDGEEGEFPGELHASPSAGQTGATQAEDDLGADGQPHPARDLVVAQLRKVGRPIHVRDLERTFTRQTMNRLGGDWRDLETMLEELVQTGEVIRTRRRTYGLPEAMNLVRGRFQASAAGFGFVVPDSGGEDFYVAPENTMEAWNGDIVLVRMEGRGDTGRGGQGPRRGQRGDGSPRASVVRIVQRAYKQLVGSLEFSKGHPILKPDDHRARHRILLLPEGIEGLQSGARVVTALFWPEHTGEDEVFGQVTRVLGAEDDPETETEAVIVKYGLRGEFPDEVLAEANAIPTELPAEALVGRLDLRDFNIFTVDGRDAKDFDDAIHIQPTPGGTFVVGVHIADVSHYVREGTPLDKEAYARATSVYLPGRVLPMLPEHLSNGVCSLVPHEDRLTMTALVELSAEGDILDVRLTPSVIRSKARLTYDEVQAYSEATSTLPDHARHLEGDLHLLLKITSKLRQKRLREGSLDFKLREVKVDVGPGGRMELIPIREETARGMIEDLMLLANKVVARSLIEREVPALFRIHEEPTLQKFQDVTNALGRLGVSFPGGEPTPQAYQAVLKGVRGTPRESVVNTLLLRSMQQAKYAGENLGHFGLAFREYLHFTSPIRRYPDLLVHRVLKGVLAGDLTASSRGTHDLRGRLPGMGEHTSERERSAAEAERDLTKYYQAKWAQEHLGETFPGNVSGVVASGLFVALDNGVEGKLHISNLDDDYYIYLEDAQILRGRSNGRTFRLGDALTVTISQVNPLARQIDFTQETAMDGDTPVRPRARRREDREAEKREKLQSVSTAAPRKFTLDEPQPATPATPARADGGRGRGQGRDGQGQGREGGGRDSGSRPPMRPSSQGGGYKRRVITLERPRNEHLRPVNITVQRMYFGDWTVENMPPDEGQGAGGGGRGFDRSDRGGRGQGFSRGGSDRGAVPSLNGRQGGGRPPRPQPQQAQATPQGSGGQGGSDAEAQRRRRRRGRRGGNGGQG
ncbi:ribonuclease R [Deinococcus aestuarii]|uniref:ribonuclease R n=1 Tax=Deinococcus aestuarii TaxID=2774531 RepID=UPI001FEC4630|nr:ribonuclease R [Deinococcus aestuarii]